jgi:hypothetical protein
MIYKFGEFELRPADGDDRALAAEWTKADPAHAGTTRPEFWIEQRRQVNSFLLWHMGRVFRDPVFFFRIDERPKAQIEVHIQFSGPEALKQRLTRRGLVEGFAWLEKMLAECGFEGYYFHSRNAPLIFFCQNRLGFAWDGTKLHRDLRSLPSGQAESKDAQCAARQ